MDEARAAAREWVMERLTRCEEFHIGRQAEGARRLMCGACVADAVAQAVQERDTWQEEARRYASNADHWREKSERQAEAITRLRAAMRVMLDRPSGPGEGMLSESADVDEQLAWVDKFREIVEPLLPTFETEPTPGGHQ